MDTLISKTKIHDRIAAEATIKKNLMVQGACSSWRMKALKLQMILDKFKRMCYTKLKTLKRGRWYEL